MLQAESTFARSFCADKENLLYNLYKIQFLQEKI